MFKQAAHTRWVSLIYCCVGLDEKDNLVCWAFWEGWSSLYYFFFFVYISGDILRLYIYVLIYIYMYACIYNVSYSISLERKKCLILSPLKLAFFK